MVILHLADQGYTPDENVKNGVTDNSMKDINSGNHLIHSSWHIWERVRDKRREYQKMGSDGPMELFHC